jgi:hypothetical protein
MNRKLIGGRAGGGHMRTSLICDAVDMGTRNHTLTVDCIFYSDRAPNTRPIPMLSQRFRSTYA